MNELDKPNLLIVDDRKENLLVLETILKGLDINIIKANSGEEALWKVMQHEFFLVILDIQMPGMDGFETANYIRLRVKNKDIPIIFITAGDTTLDKKINFSLKACEANAVDYLTKPIDPTALVGKVNKFLKIYKLTKPSHDGTKGQW